MRVRLLPLALGVTLTACAAQGPSVRSVWLPAYVFGAFGGGDLDVRDYCASGVADELSVGSSWAGATSAGGSSMLLLGRNDSSALT